MNIVVRDYEEKDLGEVNQILKEAFSTEKINFQGEEFHEVVAMVEDRVGGYLLLTKVLNPILNHVYFLIDYVCVASQYRGMGLGEKMLEYAEVIARSNYAMYLQQSCSRFRVPAHKLYEKCGFYMRDSDIFRKDII